MSTPSTTPDDADRAAAILEELRSGDGGGLNELAAKLGEAGQLVAVVIRLASDAEALALQLPPEEARVLLERVGPLLDMAQHLLPESE